MDIAAVKHKNIAKNSCCVSKFIGNTYSCRKYRRGTSPWTVRFCGKGIIRFDIHAISVIYLSCVFPK